MKAAVTARAPLWGGRVDCVVLNGGQAIVLHGRTSTIEARELTDRIFAMTKPVKFRLDGTIMVGRDAEEFADKLFEIAKDCESTSLPRVWLRDLVTRGAREMLEWNH